MPRMLGLTVLLLSLVAFRVTRFILEDSLIEEPREWVRRKLIGMPSSMAKPMPVWRRKLLEIVECPWCMSVWVSAGTVALAFFTWDAPRPPLFWEWLFVCGASIILYHLAEKLAD
jgi:hypothetical protein